MSISKHTSETRCFLARRHIHVTLIISPSLCCKSWNVWTLVMDQNPNNIPCVLSNIGIHWPSFNVKILESIVARFLYNFGCFLARVQMYIPYFDVTGTGWERLAKPMFLQLLSSACHTPPKRRLILCQRDKGKLRYTNKRQPLPGRSDTYIYIYICTYTSIAFVKAYIYMFNIDIYIYIHIFLNMCIYIYIYTIISLSIAIWLVQLGWRRPVAQPS